jgi:hypothetical protein
MARMRPSLQGRRLGREKERVREETRENFGTTILL